MMGTRFSRLLLCTALAAALPLVARAQQPAETTEPYRMLRSLQFVQDSVVQGDHSAAEMQRFMLETIDKRLRTADASVFEDPRNVDAALVYAMSGGNPDTLEYLVSRDVDGHFDSKLTDALRKYLNGKGTLIAKTLAEMVPEYRDTKVGGYLALVAANVAVTKDPNEALKFYDLARLAAPGTIVEEAALRRSLSVSLDSAKIDKAMRYANGYARRFLHSPYASQFADLFVKLVVENYEHLPHDDVMATLDSMDSDRQREIYLRIARASAIAGKKELARLAAERALALSKNDAAAMASLANLYGGLANVPTSDVGEALQAMTDIPDEALTASDRALREAARAVAEEVIRMPDSLPVSEAPVVENAAVNPDLPQDPRAPAPTPVEAKPQPVSTDAPADAATDPAFRSFVDTGRSKLDAIDNLLKEESTSR